MFFPDPDFFSYTIPDPTIKRGVVGGPMDSCEYSRLVPYHIPV
jgi:hypothetical protein